MTKLLYCTVFCSSEEPETPFIFHTMAESLDEAQEKAIVKFKEWLHNYGFSDEAMEDMIADRAVTTIVVSH